MNAYQFSQAEQAHEDKTLSAHYAEEDYAEDMDEELQAEADEIWASEIVEADGSYREGMLEEAAGEMSEDQINHWQKLVNDHQDQASGTFIRLHVRNYWKAWCRREAEKSIAARHKRAADEAAIDRAERRSGSFFGGTFA